MAFEVGIIQKKTLSIKGVLPAEVWPSNKSRFWLDVVRVHLYYSYIRLNDARMQGIKLWDPSTSDT